MENHTTFEKPEIFAGEIIIVDDKASKILAQEIISLQIEGAKVTAISNFEELKKLLSNKGIPRFFLVDINHGGENPKLGLLMIEVIKDAHPDAFIVGYSSSDMCKLDCIRAGADMFNEKSVESHDDFLEEIKERVIRHFRTAFTWQALSEYYGKILDVNSDEGTVWVHLENKVNRARKIEKFFKIERFYKIKKMYVGAPFLLTQYEIINKEGVTITKTEFEDGDQSFFPEEKYNYEVEDNPYDD